MQTQLPLTLIPIRIDLEIPAHQPLEPFPLLRGYQDRIDPSHPAYRRPDPVPPYRLKDAFLWNLHEALVTPDQHAVNLVRELDLPNPQAMAVAISNQIRQQLEEYAGVALHPLFRSAEQHNGTTNVFSHSTDTRDTSATPASTAVPTPRLGLDGNDIASSDVATSQNVASSEGGLNPDDAYRCIVNLNINLQNKLYTDKFEWSLLYSDGEAEEFAKVTCAEVGLGPEWVSSMAHGIYESVLKLKKEACESGGLVSGLGGYGTEIDNLAVNGRGAGWRYDPEGLGDEWEPKVEALSKEEIERREGDRERQIRRLRRETARFSSTSGIAPELSRQGSTGYFDVPDSSESFGRGERNKRKLGRSGTPGRGTPDTGAEAGYGGGGGTLTDGYVETLFPLINAVTNEIFDFRERPGWRCSHCLVWGSGVWAVRDGPSGQRVSISNLHPSGCLCLQEPFLRKSTCADYMF